MSELSLLKTNSNVLNLAEMPKAELHLHLEGSPRWDTLRSALQRHTGLTLPEFSPFCTPGFRFAEFSEFQNCFRRYICPWLEAPSGYAELIRDVFDSLIEQKIRYAEVNINVSFIDRCGASLDAVLQLLSEEIARANSQGTIIRMIAGISRTEGIENASYWVRRLAEIPIISGFDLHSIETASTRAELFSEAFAPARDAGKKIKAHAGEMDGPESIRSAVEKLGVKQIGHGIAAIQDPEVVELLIKHKVLLEICPTSNERLGNVSSYNEHPILQLDAAGVVVTVNSDDPTFFGINLTGEMERLVSERSVSAGDLVRWTRNALSSAILDETIRSAFETELDEWLRKSGDRQ